MVIGSAELIKLAAITPHMGESVVVSSATCSTVPFEYDSTRSNSAKTTTDNHKVAQ